MTKMKYFSTETFYILLYQSIQIFNNNCEEHLYVIADWHIRNELPN